ncbi:MAG: division/cell wall cluster transcriptional repressor MraZ [Peptococcaceae bacterium]|nr:division/cell wall cluster transcriptional repressor MraZ [Peptococcaceae bacterium]MBQ2036139.1 division/cell wall cluster transcriptional repressor MraZ [Peptococcaceae bacterium]MBQ2120530.1 division/cell wall cluster transcriptional repressor MraZ [Peptococcaceae bacterium]MBQ2449312.1 division/cell wall cluster transcriptional repressor MraZ [Peptococcaceae bacterium]MBQ5652710.1 division/cell wall cluster transcriptional repressor MraZ [Peptococcaceae bacterium]
MFFGEYEHTIDTKGRVIIPAKLREELGDVFMITKGLDGCLSVYSMDQWAAFEAKLQALPMNQPDARAFARFFFSGATEGELDKQGRVMLPPNMREHAHLTKDVVIAGAGNRLEIWDKATREQYLTTTASPEEMAAKMSDMGFLI